MASRPRRRGIKRRPEIERHKGVTGRLYKQDGDKVVEVHGAIVGDFGFIFKARTRYGGTPRTATIVKASGLFTTAKAAADAMKTKPGWAYTYGDTLIPVKVTTDSQGGLTALDENGSWVHCQKVFLDKREAARHAIKEVANDLEREKRDYQATVKKMRGLKAMLRSGRRR